MQRTRNEARRKEMKEERENVRVGVWVGSGWNQRRKRTGTCVERTKKKKQQQQSGGERER